MNEQTNKLICALQASMVESAKTCFGESELGDLRCVIRLSVEFSDYLRSGGKPRLEPRYTCESILAAVEPFMSLTRAYKVLDGATDTPVNWNTIPLTALRLQFASMFGEFCAEENFEKKCRKLLDLFKLQIIYAGMTYD